MSAEKYKEALPKTVLPILLAGGEGSRLHPITADLPKPLIPVDGIPAICRILDTLAVCGASRAVITVRYRAQDIIDLLGERYRDIRLYYSHETDAPRGTAGGVRDAWDTYAADDDSAALVISGDAVFTCDLPAFAAYQTEKAADAALLCVSVPDPGAFGIVNTDEDGRITGFSEKPCAAETLSDTVNTGIYCLSRSFLERIPTTGAPDFGQDVFPDALQNGQAMYAFHSDRYWCDIGSFSAYLNCSLDISAGRIPDTDTPRRRTVLPPHISDSSIGAECFIPSSASVRQSILFDRVKIGSGASVAGSIICEGVVIGDGAIVESGCVIGKSCVIDAHVRVPRGSRLEGGTRMTAGEKTAEDGFRTDGIAVSHHSRNAFDTEELLACYAAEIGYVLSVHEQPQPEIAVAFARALAAFAQKENAALFICHAEEHPHLNCIEALLCETLACSGGGISVFRADSVLSLSAARMPSLPLPEKETGGNVFRIVLMRRGGRPTAAVFDGLGLYPARGAERRMDACFADALSAMTGQRTAAPKSRLCPVTVVRVHDLNRAYVVRYMRRLPQTRSIPFLFSCGLSPNERLLAQLLCAMGAEETASAPLRFSVSRPSEDCGDILCPLTVSDLRDPAVNAVCHWKVLSLFAGGMPGLQTAKNGFPTPRIPSGGDVQPLSLPVCAPEMLRADFRYSHTPSVSDRAAADDARVLARRYAAMEAEDAVLLARDLVCLLAFRGCSFGALLKERQESGAYPDVPTFRRYGMAIARSDIAVPLSLSANLSGLIRGHDTDPFYPAVEGVVCRRGDGIVRVVATRDRNFRIIADAFSAETAESLFRFAKERLLCRVTSSEKQ